MRSETPDLGSEKPDLGSERPDLGLVGPDLRSERPALRSERPDLGSERPDLRSQRLDLRSQRPALRSQRPDLGLWGGVDTDIRSENCPVWNHRSSTPPGPLPKKREKQVAQGQYVVSDTRCPALYVGDCR